MATNSASGEISKPPPWGYDSPLGEFAKQLGRLIDYWDKGGSTKIEESESPKAPDRPKNSQEESSKKEEEDDEDDEEEEQKAYEARRRALAKIAIRKRRLMAERLAAPQKNEEEEEAQRKKLEELKSKIAEVKKRVEEAKSKREEAKMEARANGKASVGAVSEERPTGGAATVPTIGSGEHPLPAYWGELTMQAKRLQQNGLLSSG